MGRSYAVMNEDRIEEARRYRFVLRAKRRNSCINGFCGAADCQTCFPGNHEGEIIECVKCGDEFYPEGDDRTLCDSCYKVWAEETV